MDDVEHVTDAAGVRRNQVDVLGVARGGRDVELAKRGAASEREAVSNRRSREQLDERARDDEILLDLPIEHPWGAVAPLGDEVLGDHWRKTSATRGTF